MYSAKSLYNVTANKLVEKIFEDYEIIHDFVVGSELFKVWHSSLGWLILSAFIWWIN